MWQTKISNIEWLGTYPAHWQLKKIKYCLQERVEKNNPVKTTNILSLTAKQGVIPYDEKEGGGNKPKEDVRDYRLAYPGDIVMNSMNILSGSVGLSNYFGCVSPVYYMLRPFDKDEDVRFYNYIFQTTVFQKSLFGLGNGILIKESGNGKLNTIRMRIPMEKFGNLFIPVAGPIEQHKIANYLDQKCSEIDAITKDIQTQIDTLEQYKRSVITEAVTKGLDPDVEMKDSGIEWIGKIPNTWELLKAKYCVNITNGSDPKTDGNIPVYGSGATSFKSCGEYKDGPAVLIGRKGATLHIPHYVENRYWNVDTAFDVKAKQGFSLRYYYYLAVVFDYGYYLSQTTLPSMTQSNYNSMKIPFPPSECQDKIVCYIDNKCKSINAIITEKQSQLSILSDYKKSLIYEYVTGKKEVPVE